MSEENAGIMLATGQTIAGKYQLERQLGSGGMGSVWLALHVELGSHVALKFQHFDRIASQKEVARFRREARAAARLRSANIVHTYDYGFCDGTAYIAMEFLVGESLRARLTREHRLTTAAASDVVRQVAAALDIAHQAEVIHRDVKPSNLLIVQDGANEVLKLLDFGIAKWADPADTRELTEFASSRAVIGSAPYMSPEQACGRPIDHRTDLWSLAVVAYEMLTGTLPFVGSNLPATLMKVEQAVFEVPSARLGGGSSELDRFFLRAFSPNIESRFRTARALAEEFELATHQLPQERIPERPQLTDLCVGRLSETVTMGASATSSPPMTSRASRWRPAWVVASLVLTILSAWRLFDPSQHPSPLEPTAVTGSAPTTDSAAGAAPATPLLSAASAVDGKGTLPTSAPSASCAVHEGAMGCRSDRTSAITTPAWSRSTTQRPSTRARETAKRSEPRPSTSVVDPFSGLEIPSGT